MKTSGTYDVIVIGVGGMGSATVYELASRGMRVWASNVSAYRTTLGRPTASTASSGWPTMRTRPTCRSCDAPMSVGTIWRG